MAYGYPYRVKKLSERTFRSWTGATLRETKWLLSDGTTETDETVVSLNDGSDGMGGGWRTDDYSW